MRTYKRILITVCACISVCTLAIPGLAEERFVDNGDGTITDTLTGLMWAQSSSPGDITWQDAEIYSRNPAMDSLYLKYDDWRLPTIEELKTLYLKKSKGYETDCGLKIRIDPVFEVTCAWFWSADLPETPEYSKKDKARKIKSVMAYSDPK